MGRWCKAFVGLSAFRDAAPDDCDVGFIRQIGVGAEGEGLGGRRSRKRKVEVDEVEDAVRAEAHFSSSNSRRRRLHAVNIVSSTGWVSDFELSGCSSAGGRKPQ
ncbi:hypothetical protein BaRGS_00007844 [Batillaria attramentaria]|uniref:Uncharacterized protein n=1 Tax=Batillaria attramentaria TaxID=370345 RepID=A0ABD0LPL1_9CAEN